MKHKKKKSLKAYYSQKGYGAGRRDEAAKHEVNSSSHSTSNNDGPGAGTYLASFAVAGPIGPLLVWFGWGK